MSCDDRVDRALDTLGHLSGAAPWQEPDQLRRIARRRTISRRTLLGAGALAVAGGVTDALLPGDSSPRRSTPPAAGKGVHVGARSGPAVELVAEVKALSTGSGDVEPGRACRAQFALDLLRTSSSEHNLVLSPSSLAIALAMQQFGARGRTRDEIATALHTANLSDRQQASGRSTSRTTSPAPARRSTPGSSSTHTAGSRDCSTAAS